MPLARGYASGPNSANAPFVAVVSQIGNWRFAVSEATSTSIPLNVLIIMGISVDALRNLRHRFPAVRFVVPGEETDSDGRYRIAEATPSEEELSDADVIVGWQVSPAQLAHAQRLRWFHAGSAGVEHLDLMLRG